MAPAKRARRRIFAVLLAVATVGMASVACRTRTGLEEGATTASTLPPGAKPLLDVNDVSVLFPLPEASHLNALLSLPAGLPGRQLLSQPLFTKFAALSGWVTFGSRDAAVNYPQLRIVSFRVDPCAPRPNPDPKKCLPQLRLIAQPIQVAAGFATTLSVEDSTLHLVYSLSGAEFTSLLAELRALKTTPSSAATTGLPLGPHPGLVAEAAAGKDTLSKALQDLVLKYASEQNLAFIAFMFLEANVVGQANFWHFGAADVAGTDVHVRPLFAIKDPTVPTMSLHMRTEHAGPPPPGGGPPPSLGEDPAKTRNGIINPVPTGVDNVAFFLDSNRYKNGPRDATAHAAFASLLNIENPRDRDITNVDCISCHTATQMRSVALTLKFKESDKRYDATRFVPPPGPTFNLRRQQGGATMANEAYVTINLGYFHNAPSISQRAVNETVLVAKFLNDAP